MGATTTIAHAAALAPEDDVPFEHGVALSRASGAKLFSVHVNGANGDASAQMPRARDVLTRWGDTKTAVDHEIVLHDRGDDLVASAVSALSELEPDLVIAATHQREGLARAFYGSVAEGISHSLSTPSLLLPIGQPGFVSRSRGAIHLRRVLVPMSDEAEGLAAVSAATRLIEMAGAREVELVLLHVGSLENAPKIEVPESDGWAATRTFVVASGKVDEAIVTHSRRSSIVVMASRGHDSVGDVLLGSHTDRVLRRTNRAVLSVPLT